LNIGSHRVKVRECWNAPCVLSSRGFHEQSSWRFHDRASVGLGRAEAVVDPNVPPMPPHISFEQARMFTRAALRDAEVLGFPKQAFKEGAAGVLHRK
jgi:hypothetical protein